MYSTSNKILYYYYYHYYYDYEYYYYYYHYCYYYYYCLIVLAQAVLIADIFLMGGLQQVSKGQEVAFTLHV